MMETRSNRPFDAGPFTWAPAVPLPAAGTRPWTVAFLVAVVTWVPLALLSAAEGLALPGRVQLPFLVDLAMYGRYLVAAPAFVYASFVFRPQLAVAVHEFVNAGLVAEADRPRFDALLRSTGRLVRSRWTDAAIVVAAYAWTLSVGHLGHPRAVSWWLSPSAGELSLAGWWRQLVSQPLFLTIVGTWLWCLLLWVRFLWHVSRMNLQLVVAHPDLMGGLRFTLLPQRGFSILAFGLGAMAAGSVGEQVLLGGVPLADYRYFVGGQVLFVLAIFVGPTLILAPSLLRAQAAAMLNYGRLASRLGLQFEERWLRSRPVDSDALGVPDFSATTDLYSIVGNVSAVQLLLIETRLALFIAMATLAPYAPLVFALMPIDQIVDLMTRALL